MITYREYDNADWKAICQIHDRARPDELKGSCDPRGFIPIEQDKEVEDLKSCTKFVACDGETVIGFVGVDDKYLAWLYIDPSHYGRGSDVSCCASAFARSVAAHGRLFWMVTIPPSNFMNQKVSRKHDGLVVKITVTQLRASGWNEHRGAS